MLWKHTPVEVAFKKMKLRAHLVTLYDGESRARLAIALVSMGTILLGLGLRSTPFCGQVTGSWLHI